LFLLQLTSQEDRFLLFNKPLGVAGLPDVGRGAAGGRGDDDDDDDDARSVSSLSSQSSVASEVAGPSLRASKKKKKLPAKQVLFMT
jgi:hypothetical protein